MSYSFCLESGKQIRSSSCMESAVFRWLLPATIVLWVIVMLLLIPLMAGPPYDPDFEVDSMSFSLLNISRGYDISAANWTVGVFASNTNRCTRMAFDNLEASLYYKDVELSRTKFPPFGLGPKEQTSMVAPFQVLKNYLTGDDIAEDKRRHRIVNFDVELNVKLTYYSLLPGVFGRKIVRHMQLLCSNTKVGFSSKATNQGTMVGDSYGCYCPEEAYDYY